MFVVLLMFQIIQILNGLLLLDILDFFFFDRYIYFFMYLSYIYLCVIFYLFRILMLVFISNLFFEFSVPIF